MKRDYDKLLPFPNTIYKGSVLSLPRSHLLIYTFIDTDIIATRGRVVTTATWNPADRLFRQQSTVITGITESSLVSFIFTLLEYDLCPRSRRGSFARLSRAAIVCSRLSFEPSRRSTVPRFRTLFTSRV